MSKQKGNGKNELAKSWAEWVRLFLAIAAPSLAIVATLLVIKPTCCCDPTGTIKIINVTGTTVSIEGQLKCIPKSSYVWVAEQSDNNIWPKELKINAQSPNWSGNIYQNASPSFHLILFYVDEKDHKKISSWFDECKTTEKYPGIPKSSLRITELNLAVYPPHN